MIYDVKKRIEELTMGKQEQEAMITIAREVKEAAIKECKKFVGDKYRGFGAEECADAIEAEIKL